MNKLYRSMVEAAAEKAVAVGRYVVELEHKGLRGRAREIFISDLLGPFLYPSMDLCTGVIIDASGRQSRQTDVIVFDRSIVPPIRFNAAEGAIPCEAVLFAIEIKSVLTKVDLQEAVEWARSIKELQFGTALVHALAASRGRESRDEPIKLGSVPCALFAFDTDLSGESIEKEAQRLQAVVAEQNRIRVPLSAVTIATRGHLECIEARSVPPVFEWHVATPPTDAAVRFVAWIMRHAAAVRAQRAPIALDQYLFSFEA